MMLGVISTSRVLSYLSYSIQQEEQQDAEQDHKVNGALIIYTLQEARPEKLLPSRRRRHR